MKKFLCIALLPAMVLSGSMVPLADHGFKENESRYGDFAQGVSNESYEVTECDGTYIMTSENDEFRVCATVHDENCVVSTIFSSTPTEVYEVHFLLNDVSNSLVDYNSNEFWGEIQQYGLDNLNKANIIEINFNDEVQQQIGKDVSDSLPTYTAKNTDVVMEKLKSTYGEEYTLKSFQKCIYKNKQMYVKDSLIFEKEAYNTATWQSGVALATIVTTFCVPGSGLTAKIIRGVLVSAGVLSAADTLLTATKVTNYRAMARFERYGMVGSKIYSVAYKICSHQCIMTGSVCEWSSDEEIIYDPDEYYYTDTTKLVSDAYDMWLLQ